MDVMEKAHALEAGGDPIVHLEVGEPDFDTPLPIKEAAARALAAGHTHYTHSLGIPELREEICRYYEREYGVKITPERTIVTSGTSPALLLVFAALLDPGDEVILSDPHYACYPNTIRLAGGSPVYVPLREEEGFRYHPEAIRERIGPRTRAILINSPANPTGIVLPPEQLQALAGLDITVVSDEIYHGLVYEGRAHSLLEYTDDCIVINGFSKRYAMTGWRLGYAIVPPGLVRAVQKLQQNLFICASSLAQHAAISALTECEEYVREMVSTYDARRRHLIRRLREIGLGVAVEPTGAFYVLANARRFSRDSYALAMELLEKARVAVAPGIDFGANAEGYLRFSYANSVDNIEEGMCRLAAYLATRRG
ncbi:MAG TPA: pyridoxal phosphate-dependent aminotransferase [Firmicutes bacterium]|nr:pyridoxal phosphate-dependent aminotransferase [Bacillota bacterium]